MRNRNVRNKKKSLKKKIILTWLALELAAIPFVFPVFAALPTFAKIIQSSPEVDMTRVVSANIPAPDGVSRYLVASDASFVIIANNLLGDVETNIIQKGNIAGARFGALTQNIAVKNTCLRTLSTTASIIYRSAHKTADNTGSIIDQTVLIEMRYDPKLSPKFTFKTQLQIKAQIKTENLRPTSRCGV